MAAALRHGYCEPGPINNRQTDGAQSADSLAPAWERLSTPGDKCRAHWRHRSGWEIRHCGHPTANWPYYAIDPAYPDRTTVTHNGKGFRTLRAAQAAVEAILAGTATATNDRCGPSTRRVLDGGDSVCLETVADRVRR